jgi:hypothetical protein
MIRSDKPNDCVSIIFWHVYVKSGIIGIKVGDKGDDPGFIGRFATFTLTCLKVRITRVCIVILG